MACLPHTRVSLLLPLLLLIVAGFFTVPCHCASPTDNTSQPGPAKEPQTLLDLCKTVHSYLALSFWKAINQNPALIYSLPPDNDTTRERRGYGFRLLLRKMGLKQTVKGDVKGDIDRYVDGVVREIRRARGSEAKELPESMRKFIPVDQQELLQKVFKCEVMSDNVLNDYSFYVKKKAEIRMKLVQNTDEFTVKSLGHGAYDLLVRWATTLPDEEFYEGKGWIFNNGDLQVANWEKYNAENYLSKLLQKSVEEYAQSLVVEDDNPLQPAVKESFNADAKRIRELKPESKAFAQPSGQLFRTIDEELSEERKTDSEQRDDKMRGSPFDHLHEPFEQDSEPIPGDVAGQNGNRGDALSNPDGLEGNVPGEDARLEGVP